MDLSYVAIGLSLLGLLVLLYALVAFDKQSPRNCLLCGVELPRHPWWKRLFYDSVVCEKAGLDVDVCWYRMSKKMGVNNPGPRPKRGE